ncbi:MAG: YitT family protein, partial [Pseudomonadota bacterium]
MARLTFGHWDAKPDHHSVWEDALGIFTGVVLVALSLTIYRELGMVTGGVAGMALIASYATGWPAGVLFFCLNLPFYGLAILRMGWAFTLKTFAGVAALSILVDLSPRLINFESIDPIAAMVLAGLLLGFGLLALFRHRASLGGVGILALYLQDRFHWRAGLTQLVIDLCILATAVFVVEPYLLALSVGSAVLLNGFLAINHREDRYIAR